MLEEVAIIADNVSITAGSGTTVGTEERTINGTAVQVQRVDELGSALIATSQVAPTTTAATLVAARDSRKTLTLTNIGTVDVWIGPATVTPTNGHPLGVGYSLTIGSAALVQGITAAGTGLVACLELFDA